MNKRILKMEVNGCFRCPFCVNDNEKGYYSSWCDHPKGPWAAFPDLILNMPDYWISPECPLPRVLTTIPVPKKE